ncbi:hypothetical protein RTTH1527_02330 [Rickettsia typhi str. TH1527]|uniref:Uncharacterized protein n=1 Tax=Rickettsia typhi str. TH1527 TaxID=1003201 RepID=A0ABM5MUQ3_RICTP|nr:hypothetical protein RTTH1527_02330 [Rickettsia typhi str. TH1527]
MVPVNIRQSIITLGLVPQKRYRRVFSVRVKRCGKSTPVSWQQVTHGQPHQEQDQIGITEFKYLFKFPGYL